ncbi:MAG: hypothetical protein MSIBF_01445 [Candidatus Altiarchaeales archaeon IMC4]|nr:MAG: hypothetical protein MSIBF_01445 [Candidatus Altiarchaeales archaeon IMC4]
MDINKKIYLAFGIGVISIIGLAILILAFNVSEYSNTANPETLQTIFIAFLVVSIADFIVPWFMFKILFQKTLVQTTQEVQRDSQLVGIMFVIIGVLMIGVYTIENRQSSLILGVVWLLVGVIALLGARQQKQKTPTIEHQIFTKSIVFFSLPATPAILGLVYYVMSVDVFKTAVFFVISLGVLAYSFTFIPKIHNIAQEHGIK